jgi:class 3 adenylate cyclase
MLEGRRADIVAVFGDLRGFAAFSTRTPPEEVMQVLSEYLDALGTIISQHHATLTSFSGDGLMILVNAPVPVPDPVLKAIDMAVAMQDAVQRNIGEWRSRGTGSASKWDWPTAPRSWAGSGMRAATTPPPSGAW